MFKIFFLLIFSSLNTESIDIETTFVLPPLTKATISENGIHLPPQLPNLVPKDIRDSVPKQSLSDLNRVLFELGRNPISCLSISLTQEGNLLVIDSSQITSLVPPHFKPSKSDKTLKELSKINDINFLDVDQNGKHTLIGTKSGSLIIVTKGNRDTLTGFSGPVRGLSLNGKIVVSDTKAVYELKKALGRWKQKELLWGHFDVFKDPSHNRFLVLQDDGTVRELLLKGSSHLGDSIFTLPRGARSPLLFDVTLDGRDDILFVKDGRARYYPALPHGGFLRPDTTYTVLMDERFPYAPSIDFFKDGTMVLATKEGEVYTININKNHGKFQIEKKHLITITYDRMGDPYPVIRVLDKNQDGNEDLVIGTKDGNILVYFGPKFEEMQTINFSLPYSSPTTLEGHLVSGSIDGKIHYVKSLELVKGIHRLDSGSVFPYSCDINGDGTEELFVGTQSGKVLLFFKNNGEWIIDSSFQIDVGEMAIPALYDFDGDGDLDLFVSNVDGRVYYFENQGALSKEDLKNPDGALFIEKYSWSFKPSGRDSTLGAYYNRIYLPLDGFELRSLTDSLTVKKFIKLLKRTPRELRDEAIYTIITTPPEVLRVIAHLDEEDLLLENARDVYRADSSLPYTKIIDIGNGLSTIVYDGKDTLPPELYYRFVVNPRILYEIPLRVNVDYWKKDSSYYGISYVEWLRHEEDIYDVKGGGEFWRTVFLKDSTFGKSPLDLGKLCKSTQEVVESLYLFQGPEAGGCMSFGYKTQDLQPLQIYQKAYGSCGEQSILFCALARTLLIPCYVVIDPGEDHQWNEFWTDCTWNHLDINWKPEKGIACPATSLMKKPITAVIGWGPDDRHFSVNLRYIDTAEVKIKVLTPSGTPLPGALVVVRSHWQNRNSIGYWTYTDAKGVAKFGVGYQPKGYTLEIMSPFGTSGAENILFQENKTYDLQYRVPKKFNLKGDRLYSSFDGRSFRVNGVKAYSFRQNLITSSPYRIKSKTLREAGYEGTKLQRVPIGNGLIRIETNSLGDISIENPFPLTEEVVTVSMHFADSVENPKIEITGVTKETKTAGKVHLKGTVRDNIGVGTLKIQILRKDSIIRKYDITEHLQSNESFLLKKSESFDVKLDLGKGGPILPGIYTIKVIATDLAGNVGFKEITGLKVDQTNEFKDQLVFQDNPEDSLPSGSWIMHFFVKEPVRFLLFETEAPKARGLDLDIFLYKDKNGDGKPQKKEKVASSTSPTCNERIFISLPEAGEYWFYAQGCTVKTPPQPFNLRTSFYIDEKGDARE